MKYFKISWQFRNNPIVAALHKWYLPGVNCSVCGETWGAIGCEYPAVDLSALASATEYRAKPVGTDRLEALRARVRPLLSKDLPLPPATAFGTLVGRALGKVGDFAWQKTMTPLITNKALERLKAAGITSLQCVPAEVKLRGQSDISLFVLHIEPRARFHRVVFKDGPVYCSGCGLKSCQLQTVVAIDSRTIPVGVDIFRIIDFETNIIISERLANAITLSRLTDIAYSEIAVM